MQDISLFFGRFHPLIVHIPIGIIMFAFALAMVSNRPMRKFGLRRSLVFNVTLLGLTFFGFLFGLLRVFPEYLLFTGNLFMWVGLIWAAVRPESLHPSSTV